MNSSKPIKKGQIEDYISDSTQAAIDAISGATNLTYTTSATQGTVNSDTGTDAVIPLADATNAGLLSPTEKVEISTALQPGDITQYTNEEAQDAIGTILLDSTTIDLSYNDGVPSISANVKPNSITASELSNTINNSEFINDSDYATEAYVDSKIPTEYSKVVYVNSNTPNTATIFDVNNPPTVNDDTLKTDVNNLYVGLNGSTWVYNSTSLTYTAEPITSGTSNFYLAGTIIDAGGNKVTAIERTGTVGGAPAVLGNQFVTKTQVENLFITNAQTFNQSRWQFSDFTNVSANQGPYIGAALASGTLGSSGVTSSGDLNSLGHVILNSSASANSGYRLLDAGGVAMCPKLGITFLGKFGLDSSAAGRDRITRMGFHSTQNQVAPVNGVYLEVLGNTASFKTTSGGITTSSSTVTLDDTFTGSSVVLYSVFITFIADRTARCVLYNSAMTALLTITFTTADNMPSLGSRFNSGIITTITTAGAIANICQVDYMGVGIAKPSFLNNY